MISFKEACRRGDLKLAKEIYDRNCVVINYDIEYAFQWECRNGHLEVAKWIWSLDGVDHTKDEWAFRWACMNGHLETAKWIWSLGGVDYHALDEYAFRYACYYGHLDVAKWLFFLDSEFHNKIPNKLLNKVCQVNVFESKQVDLLNMYTKLIIS